MPASIPDIDKGADQAGDHRLLRFFFHNTCQYLVLLDTNLHISDFNTAAANYTESQFSSVLKKGRPILQYFDDSIGSHLKTLFQSALEGEKVHYEQYCNKSACISWYRFYIQPLLCPNETIAGLMLSGHDISPEKRMEKILRQQTHVLSNLAPIQCQRVRQPLESIITLTRLMNDDPGKQKEYAHGVESAAGQLNSIIQTIRGQSWNHS